MACDRGRTGPHPLIYVRECVQLLFEGGYYFFHRALCVATMRVATNWGTASIRMNMVYCTSRPMLNVIEFINGSINRN